MIFQNQLFKKKNKSRLAEDSDYAVIYFYRPRTGYDQKAQYKVKMENNNGIIGRLSVKDRFYFKTKKFGKNRFSIKANAEFSIELDVKKGEEYFIKCGINLESLLTQYEMKLMETHFGKKEYELIK